MNITWTNIRDRFSENNKQLAEYITRFSLIVSINGVHQLQSTLVGWTSIDIVFNRPSLLDLRLLFQQLVHLCH